MATKRVEVSAKFRAAARDDMEGSLAFVIMSAFGITMDVVIQALKDIAKGEDVKVALLAIASCITIRGNISYADSMEIRTKYPYFAIEGDRATGDKLNFSALRAVGFAIVAIAPSPLSAKIRAKAGSVIEGGPFPDSEAGKINKESYEKWTDADRTMFATAPLEEEKKFYAVVINDIKTKSSDFANALSL